MNIPVLKDLPNFLKGTAPLKSEAIHFQVVSSSALRDPRVSVSSLGTSVLFLFFVSLLEFWIGLD